MEIPCNRCKKVIVSPDHTNASYIEGEQPFTQKKVMQVFDKEAQEIKEVVTEETMMTKVGLIICPNCLTQEDRKIW